MYVYTYCFGQILFKKASDSLDTILKFGVLCIAQSRKGIFTVFHFGNDFEIELVGSPDTVHFNFQKTVPSPTKFRKYFKSIFSIENFFKIECFFSDKMFRFIWFDKLRTWYIKK
jgi:hypothetical protein